MQPLPCHTSRSILSMQCLQNVIVAQSCRLHGMLGKVLSTIAGVWQAARAVGIRLATPSFLECSEEAGFSSIWTAFRRLAISSAHSGWPLDPELALRFDDVSTGRSWVHPAGAVWESFRTYDSKNEVPLLPPDLQVMASGALGDGWLIRNQRGAARGHICLYGLVTALFVAYRHAVPRNEDADRHLQLVLWLLGATEGGEQLFDFMESTSWPVRSIDVELNLEMAKSERPRFVRFSRLRLLSTGSSPKALPLPERGLGASCALALPDLAVFGIHGATSLEPASAVLAAQKAAKNSGCTSSSPKVTFYGHPCPSYAKTQYLCEWPKVLPFAEVRHDADPVAELLQTLIDFADEHVEQEWSLHDSLTLLSRFVQADAAARRSFWICSGPAVLCAMLHIVEPTHSLLVWHCRHLLDGLGAQTNGTSTALLGLLRTMASPMRPPCYFLSCEAFAAKQLAWQLAVPEPQVQKRLALYVEQYKWEGLQGRPTDVLVLRSMLWSRVPGMYFRAVLQAFLRENSKVVALNFRFANDVGFVPYSDIALHRCGVLVPNDLTMAAFSEAFAMGLPLFLPSDEWLYRLQKSVPYGFMVHGASSLFGASEHDGLQSSSLPPAWHEKSQSVLAVMSWLRLSDFSTWPSTLRFSSIPDLLEGLVTTDFRSVSHRMLRWTSAKKDETLRRWAWLLRGMQDGSAWSDSEPRTEHGAKQPEEVMDSSRDDMLYAALACEHETFDKFGWPSFRALLESDAVTGFVTKKSAVFTELAISTLQKAVEDNNPGSLAVDTMIIPLKLFLANLSSGKADIGGLGGHCHLGMASALLLQAHQELLNNDVATKVAWLVGLANQLLAPLAQANVSVPVGVWPVEELSARVHKMETGSQ
eukprot:s3083_g5.t3